MIVEGRRGYARQGGDEGWQALRMCVRVEAQKCSSLRNFVSVRVRAFECGARPPKKGGRCCRCCRWCSGTRRVSGSLELMSEVD